MSEFPGDAVTSGPLARRRLLSSLDEDAGDDWTPSERAAFGDAVKRAEAARDIALRREGAYLLAAYGNSPADALRRYVSELLDPATRA